MVERMPGLVLLYRASARPTSCFGDELDDLARRNGSLVHYVLGDHRGDGARPAVAGPPPRPRSRRGERDVFLCGPPAMTDAIGRTFARPESAPSCPPRALRAHLEKGD